MRSLFLVTLALLSFGGCERGPGPIVWTPHSLTAAEDERQEELLQQIRKPLNSGMRDSLNGSLASDHSELLTLADSTGVRGTEQFYKFNVPMEGDVHYPSEMIFIVEHERIKFARWPFAEL